MNESHLLNLFLFNVKIEYTLKRAIVIHSKCSKKVSVKNGCTNLVESK